MCLTVELSISFLNNKTEPLILCKTAIMPDSTCTNKVFSESIVTDVQSLASRSVLYAQFQHIQAAKGKGKDIPYCGIIGGGNTRCCVSHNRVQSPHPPSRNCQSKRFDT